MVSGGTLRLITASALLAASLAFLTPAPADAGCGCDKPPPPTAQVRPSFASPGQTITLFGDGIRGGRYRVRFDGESGSSESVTLQSTWRKDLADGVDKFQLVVTMPALPVGPARIRVRRDGGDEVLSVERDQFTVLQAPISLEESDGVTVARCYRAAVDGQGTVYFPFNVGAISQRMIFSGLARSYPLIFDADDVAIYNTQGFLMQLLAPELAGQLYAIEDPGSPSSFELVYDRHEFVTYKTQHVHEGRLRLSQDPWWHVDGTPHVDHDNLVIAIAGRLENGDAPQAGATPPFDLVVSTALADGSTPATTRTIQWSTDCSSGSDGNG
jgi:hypothetical protein